MCLSYPKKEIEYSYRDFSAQNRVFRVAVRWSSWCVLYEQRNRVRRKVTGG